MSEVESKHKLPDWVCVHDNLGGAAAHAAKCPGAIKAAPGVTHVPANVLKPGTLVEGGPYPGIGRREMARDAGSRAYLRANCPSAVCQAAEAAATTPQV